MEAALAGDSGARGRAGAGPGSPGADPAGGAWPRCGRRSSRIPPGFPHIRHQSVPKAPAFPAPLPRHWLEKLFFTPSWSLICCGKRKRLLLNEGLRGGAGRRRGRLCVPQLRANAGVGAAGVLAELRLPGKVGQGGRDSLIAGCRPSWGFP